jgi:alkanesulfonate monooxygenase SsuD/methylene tetrahydromethanopterin reductase-like flavin-dependent oxidoreductase (luciferase family)
VADLEFGMWDRFGAHEMMAGPLAADIYERHLKMVEEAETLGYGSYFIIEHQGSFIGQITAPSVYLAAVAQRTSTIRIGAMIYQLPFHNPMRLAEEIAMLDHLSRGRVEFGTGIGVHEHEFLRWGLDFSQRQAMSEESLEIIEQAWNQESVTYNGKYWQFDDALPLPRPFQDPHPPIWAGAHSIRAFEFAARKNYHIAQNIDVDVVVAEKLAHYRKVWAESGHQGPMPRSFLMRTVHVAETDEKAREEAEPHLLNDRRLGREFVDNTRVGFGKSKLLGVGNDDESMPHLKERLRVFKGMASSYDFWIENGLAIIGSPDTVVRKLKEQQALIGYDLFCASHGIADMGFEKEMNSMRLFGKHVIPAFSKPAR